jgi:hypothetical protein
MLKRGGSIDKASVEKNPTSRSVSGRLIGK